MKKIFLVVLGFVLLCANPVLAQYGYGYERGGMGAGSWLEMMFLGLFSFIIGAFVFSWIFWMVGEKMIERKWMACMKNNNCGMGWMGKEHKCERNLTQTNSQNADQSQN